MSLKDRVATEIKQAMLAKDKDRLRALRGIKSLIMLEETKGADGTLSEADELKLLNKAAKQRRDSAAVYDEQGRDDLAAVERQELSVIETFLPRQLTEEEVRERVREIVAQTGAQGPQDMGKVMGAASKALAGQADGRTIAAVAKSLLN